MMNNLNISDYEGATLEFEDSSNIKVDKMILCVTAGFCGDFVQVALSIDDCIKVRDYLSTLLEAAK